MSFKAALGVRLGYPRYQITSHEYIIRRYVTCMSQPADKLHAFQMLDNAEMLESKRNARGLEGNLEAR